LSIEVIIGAVRIGAVRRTAHDLAGWIIRTPNPEWRVEEMIREEARMTKNHSQNSRAGSGLQSGMMPEDVRSMNPGDEAVRGTPGTGEDICPQCHGTGHFAGGSCHHCGGSGRIVKAIGGA
jgi:hypothetical protein